MKHCLIFSSASLSLSPLLCRASLDLKTLEVDKTHDICVNLVDQVGSLRLLVTITGAVCSTEHEISSTRRDEIARSYVSGL